jgi:hypothetical protein
MAVAAPALAVSFVRIATIWKRRYTLAVNKKISTEGTMSRILLTVALAALWAIAFDTVPASVSTAPGLSSAAHAGTTVKSAKSNTSDRKGKKPGNPPPTGTPGGRGY